MKTFLMISILATQMAVAKTITLNTAVIAPYQEYDLNGKLIGTSVSKVRCVIEKMGNEVNFKVMTWKKAQLPSSSSHGFFVASENERRNRSGSISDPILASEWIWYSLKGKHIGFKPTEADYKKLKIATIDSTNMHNWISKKFQNIRAYKTAKSLVDGLIKKELDVVISTEAIFKSGLENPKDIDKFTSSVAKTKNLGVYFFHNFLAHNRGFIEDFNKYIPDCR